jgi:hypothetical protein
MGYIKSSFQNVKVRPKPKTDKTAGPAEPGLLGGWGGGWGVIFGPDARKPSFLTLFLLAVCRIRHLIVYHVTTPGRNRVKFYSSLLLLLHVMFLEWWNNTKSISNI